LTPLVSRVQEHGGEQIIPFSCAFERNLSDLPPDEAAKYCEENKIQRFDQYMYCGAVKCLIAELGTPVSLIWLLCNFYILKSLSKKLIPKFV